MNEFINSRAAAVKCEKKNNQTKNNIEYLDADYLYTRARLCMYLVLKLAQKFFFPETSRHKNNTHAYNKHFLLTHSSAQLVENCCVEKTLDINLHAHSFLSPIRLLPPVLSAKTHYNNNETHALEYDSIE